MAKPTIVAAGPLRNRVTLQSPVTTLDDYGHRRTNDSGSSTSAWTTVATVWGAIEPISGAELQAALAMQSITTHKIRVRYSSTLAAINNTWRVTHGGKVYQIDSVMNTMERNREIHMRAHEVENKTP
jgi:SPP1 family predicted phage head-tail adaptor